MAKYDTAKVVKMARDAGLLERVGARGAIEFQLSAPDSARDVKFLAIHPMSRDASECRVWLHHSSTDAIEVGEGYWGAPATTLTSAIAHVVVSSRNLDADPGLSIQAASNCVDGRAQFVLYVSSARIGAAIFDGILRCSYFDGTGYHDLPVPESLCSLIEGVVRREIPDAILLDAIKHDTDLLDRSTRPTPVIAR